MPVTTPCACVKVGQHAVPQLPLELVRCFVPGALYLLFPYLKHYHSCRMAPRTIAPAFYFVSIYIYQLNGRRRIIMLAICEAYYICQFD